MYGGTGARERRRSSHMAEQVKAARKNGAVLNKHCPICLRDRNVH